MLFVHNRNHTDPALNLALEEYVLRSYRSQGSLVSLYVNETAVVVGKHQNVAQEANLLVCDALQVPVVRRISGGGTVVHDSGNLNFSFITDQTMKNVNNYYSFVQPIVELLRDYHIPADLDAHNNIVAKGKKLSGNAQFTTGGRLLTHGTLLINSNLERIRELLRPPEPKQVISRASLSRPAPVANLNAFRSGPAISIEEMKAALQAKFLAENRKNLPLTENDWDEIQQLAEQKYRTLAWNYGRSPECKIELVRKKHQIRLQLKAGKIDSIQVPGDPELEKTLQIFTGIMYHVPSIRAKAEMKESKLNQSSAELLQFLF